MGGGAEVAVVGAGYVGLVTAACLASKGIKTEVLETDPERRGLLVAGKPTVDGEPGLAEAVASGIESGALVVNCGIGGVSDEVRVVFLAVGTPGAADGTMDVSAIVGAVDAVVRVRSVFSRLPTFVVRSTVPPGTCALVERAASAAYGAGVEVVSNPEFLREGSAVADFLSPSRVVVGGPRAARKRVLETAYGWLPSSSTVFELGSAVEAELVKLSSNLALAARVSFANEVSALCERAGADAFEVLRAVGADPRIGTQFMTPGLGYGGYCFPKDVRGFAAACRAVGSPSSFASGVDSTNAWAVGRAAREVVLAWGGDVSGKRVAVWGLAFKNGVADVRSSPALGTVRALAAMGAEVRAHDPFAGDEAVRAGCPAELFSDRWEAVSGADALVVTVAWPEYASVDPVQAFKILAPGAIVVDACGLWDSDRASAAREKHGKAFVSVGRGSFRSEREP